MNAIEGPWLAQELFILPLLCARAHRPSLLSFSPVGDPRMDSGVQMPDTNQDLFDPTAPLLPEEVCWILDRALACEVRPRPSSLEARDPV